MGEPSRRARVTLGVTRAGRRCAAAAAVVVCLLVAAPGPFGSSAGAGEDDGQRLARQLGIRNGEAEASAATFALNVQQGNATIGFTYGQSFANYRDTTGTSEARALDLGVLPTLFGVEQCDGSAPILNPETFPPVTRTDSTESGAPTSRQAEAFQPGTGTAGPGPSAGFQDATATPQPSALATTESAPADIFVLAVEGGRTEVTADLTDGVRSARAVSSADELRVFGGLFTFEQPRWEAVARSGAREVASGGFTFSRATVLGVPRSPTEAMRDLEGFEAGLEELLAPLGVELELPELVVEDGRVRVTPMAFRIADMPWGAEVIAPFLGRVQPLREALTAQLLEEDCRNESALLIIDVLLGILAGSGTAEVLVGGVDVLTADTDFSAPPLQPLPVDSLAPPAPEVPLEVAPLDQVAPEPAPVEPFDSGSPGPVGSVPAPVAPVVEAAPVVSSPTTTEPDRDREVAAAAPAASARSSGPLAGTAAVTVGLVGLLGAVGLSLGERFRARRTTRRIP